MEERWTHGFDHTVANGMFRWALKAREFGLRKPGSDVFGADGGTHERRYLVESVFAATLLPSALMLQGEILDLGLPDHTMTTLSLLFSLLGASFF